VIEKGLVRFAGGALCALIAQIDMEDTGWKGRTGTQCPQGKAFAPRTTLTALLKVIEQV
jgi:hypothetical protein